MYDLKKVPDLYIQIYPQSRADSIFSVIDIVANLTDDAVTVDKSGEILKTTVGTEPPPTVVAVIISNIHTV